VKAGDAKSSVYRALAPGRQDCQITLPLRTTSCGEWGIYRKNGMVRIISPLHQLVYSIMRRHAVPLSSYEEELNVEISQPISTYISKQQVSWIPIARIFTVIHSRPKLSEGMGLILYCGLDATLLSALENLQSHDVIRKFSVQICFNASAIRILMWRRLILGFLPR
jgi:hypothetical protein